MTEVAARKMKTRSHCTSVPEPTTQWFEKAVTCNNRNQCKAQALLCMCGARTSFDARQEGSTHVRMTILRWFAEGLLGRAVEESQGAAQSTASEDNPVVQTLQRTMFGLFLFCAYRESCRAECSSTFSRVQINHGTGLPPFPGLRRERILIVEQRFINLGFSTSPRLPLSVPCTHISKSSSFDF